MPERVSSRAVDRRQLLRGAGVLGGAAAIAAVGATVATPSARADDGDNWIVGVANTSDTVTALTIAPGDAAALALTNTEGPQLHLQVVDDTTFELAVGDIANTSAGPFIGVDYDDGDGVQTTFLVTPDDLDVLVPTVLPIRPERLLDTRISSTRSSIVRQASGALTAKGQLVGGKWIDLALPGDTTEGYELGAAFFNVTAVTPLAAGYVAVYTPSVGAHPSSSTVNFQKGIDTASGGFGAVEVYNTSFVVRIYASATTHLVFDLSGVIISDTAEDSPGAKPRARALTRAARARTRAVRAAATKR